MNKPILNGHTAALLHTPAHSTHRGAQAQASLRLWGSKSEGAGRELREREVCPHVSYANFPTLLGLLLGSSSTAWAPRCQTSFQVWSAIKEDNTEPATNISMGHKAGCFQTEKSQGTWLTCLLVGWPWSPEIQSSHTLNVLFLFFLIQLFTF